MADYSVIRSFIDSLADDFPQWDDVVDELDFDRLAEESCTISAYSTQFEARTQEEFERRAIYIEVSQSELVVGMSMFHHHFVWDAEGLDGSGQARQLLIDLKNEKLGIAAVTVNAHPGLCWLYNTTNNLPVNDYPITVTPRKGFRWPWSQRRFEITTESFNGRFDSTRPYTSELADKMEIPDSLRPPVK